MHQMGLRKYKRSIAKARLTAASVGNVNRKLSRVRDGIPMWRMALTGDSGRKLERVQMNYGKLIKARKEERTA